MTERQYHFLSCSSQIKRLNLDESIILTSGQVQIRNMEFVCLLYTPPLNLTGIDFFHCTCLSSDPHIHRLYWAAIVSTVHTELDHVISQGTPISSSLQFVHTYIGKLSTLEHGKTWGYYNNTRLILIVSKLIIVFHHFVPLYVS